MEDTQKEDPNVPGSWGSSFTIVAQANEERGKDNITVIPPTWRSAGVFMSVSGEAHRRPRGGCHGKANAELA